MHAMILRYGRGQAVRYCIPIQVDRPCRPSCLYTVPNGHMYRAIVVVVDEFKNMVAHCGCALAEQAAEP